MVLEVDPQKRRISLGLKQVQANPWGRFVTYEDRPMELNNISGLHTTT